MAIFSLLFLLMTVVLVIAAIFAFFFIGRSLAKSGALKFLFGKDEEDGPPPRDEYR